VLFNSVRISSFLNAAKVKSMVIYGGYFENNSITDEMLLFDLVNNSWAKVYV